jgi:hypothetical protein
MRTEPFAAIEPSRDDGVVHGIDRSFDRRFDLSRAHGLDAEPNSNFARRTR